MNIKEAKEQIKHTVMAYLEKDDLGNFEISVDKQRPIFLIGAPGIGKTAIMEQIAGELQIGLVSYSMTHHTRQSALGLPFIEKKQYGGKETAVSEYTMSEIIASVYDTMEESGVSEGILFLDEINCVSETLSPSMLQFLQFKTFGRHRVPDGWIVVTAGNPPEYNQSVREFDIVTIDRLKYIEVTPDYEAFKEYALLHRIHPSVMTFLELKKDAFYVVEQTAEGKLFVTARAWEDLSGILRLYEKKGLPVDPALMVQYLHHPKIAREFSTFYELFHKYRADYRVEEILNGQFTEEALSRAKDGKLDERLALIGFLLDALDGEMGAIRETEDTCLRIRTVILPKLTEAPSDAPLSKSICALAEEEENILRAGRLSRSVSGEEARRHQRVLLFLNTVTNAEDTKDIKAQYQKEVGSLKDAVSVCSEHLQNAFRFLEEAFGDAKELLIFVTELTMRGNAVNFISHYGSDEYYTHSKQMLLHERGKEIARKIEALDADDI